jgi:hypothetical protein
MTQMNLPPPTDDWLPVCCAKCNLLVGWSRAPLPKPMFCIPCFDLVAHLSEDELAKVLSKEKKDG